MRPRSTHKWTFRARFRRHAFGWRSQPAIKRIKEAVSEIKKVARKEPILGAEGAVLLLEKLSPALDEHVDSSSGAIGTAVNNAIDAMVPVIAKAPADDDLRGKWLERLWDAVQEDEMPYIENLTDYWGDLCVTPECASRWADQFVGTLRMAWSPDPELHGYFKGTTACLSALLRAERNDEILELIDLAPYKSWHYREWGVKALAAVGKKAEAIRYAEDSRGLNDSSIAIALACEEILLSSGMVEEAYSRYAIEANQKTTYLAKFRTIAKKYPHSAEEIVGRVEGKEYLRTREANAIRRSDRARRSTPDGGQDMIDRGLIAMFLKMTPEERLQANDNAVRVVMELQDAFKRRKREAAGNNRDVHN